MTPKILEFSSITSLRACLKRGIGVTICPEIAVAEDLGTQELMALKWNQSDDQVPVIMIWHSEKWCSPLLTDFMNQAQKIMI
ncbi:MAG: LysR family transcriptional regulator substrate-binding protein [Proteobacteria bacterium]|nr:LysR family transcriptional regulator substrate-binding protein [Desulfobacula sp.]MBU3951571.1 LysR family transcriptional regulator substrate-binding protein [Pseudomonadota bacterium]MBU4132231.1 LysR family transcriptional regulator substrate-binding protein [Pseudomonadota bacterium]